MPAQTVGYRLQAEGAGGGLKKELTKSNEFRDWQRNQAKAQAASMIAGTFANILRSDTIDSLNPDFGDYASFGLEGAATGIAAGAAFGGPVGIAVGVGIGALSLLADKDKRKAAERKWKGALRQYKEQVREKQRALKGQSMQLEKRARGGDLQSIYDATNQAVSNISRQIDVGATGIKNVTQDERIESLEEQADYLVSSTYDKLLKKVDILGEAQDLLDSEATAHRGFGKIRGGYMDDVAEKLGELQYV